MRKNLIRRSALGAAAGAASLVLAACGSGDDASAGHDGHGSQSSAASLAPSTSASTSASRGEHNAADVAFATGMIPHHRQAVEMADLAPSRAESTEVRKVASEIKKAQGPEIKTLSGWLTSWGEQVPAQGAMNHSMHKENNKHNKNGMDGMDGMDGMMTAADMDSLAKASGKAFDTAFLTMMIEHHEGAVKMAKTEKAGGAFPGARKMANSVITSQSAEMSRMTGLLGKG
ncbi:DUF305 domain-containing protein [Streptomyces sp. NPDC016845]|uniref:DUF305 domain-containing protein n=1 Tax=Streptomyces sp. NPDC016845 TaxID=3364972 RepID=UPI003788F3E5